MILRTGNADDVQAIWEMLRDSAVEQGFPGELAVTPDDLLADGFSELPRFQALIAEVGGTPAGLALYFFNYSTWGSRRGLYLEDLFVRKQYRGLGIARQLLQELNAIAVRQGCGRFQWLVHRDNTAARHLYESFGATTLIEWIPMKITLP